MLIAESSLDVVEVFAKSRQFELGVGDVNAVVGMPGVSEGASYLTVPK